MIPITLTILIFGLAVAGLGVGVLARRGPLRGSCGGCTSCITKGDTND